MPYMAYFSNCTHMLYTTWVDSGVYMYICATDKSLVSTMWSAATCTWFANYMSCYMDHTVLKLYWHTDPALAHILCKIKKKQTKCNV